MSFWSLFRWSLFALYLTMLTSLPLGILWGLQGACAGVALSVVLLISMGHRGPEKILHQLKAREIAIAEYPAIFSIVREYSRRLSIAPPRVWLISHSGIQMGLLGYTDQSAHLLITEGALKELSRDALAALIARKLAHLSQGQVFSETWMSRFLNILDQLLMTPKVRSTPKRRRTYPWQLLLKQIILYPLCILPIELLRNRKSPERLDVLSVSISGLPHSLAEGYRLVQARTERNAFQVPFSLRHLFLFTPKPTDGFSRLFFESEGLDERIRALSRMSRLVALRHSV